MGDAIDVMGLDLLSVDTYADGIPYAALRALRDAAPVCHHPEPDGPGFWVLTGHLEVVAVSRDSATWSSAVEAVFPIDPPEEQLAGLRLMMLAMDPPDHTKLRLLVNKGFTPRRSGRTPATTSPARCSPPRSTAST